MAIKMSQDEHLLVPIRSDYVCLWKGKAMLLASENFEAKED